jgi:PKD repeat protein
MRSRLPHTIAVLALLCTAATAQFSVTTTFSSNAGEAGNMFDIVATNSVIINNFEVNIDAGTQTVAVYVVTGGGTWVGRETTSAAWTLLTTVSVASAGQNNPTNLGINLGYVIPGGTTQGFYLTCTSGPRMNYTITTAAVGGIAGSDTNLSVRIGCGKAFPFGSTFQPRIWNGRVHYSPGTGIFAGFDANPLVGNAPLTVNFTDTTFSSDPGGIVSWAWDFDNNGTVDSTAQNPSHVYTTPGLYSVNLMVTDVMNGSDSELKTDLITVEPKLLVVTTTGVGDVSIDGPPNPQGTTEGFFLVSGTPPAVVGGGAFLGLQPDALTFTILTYPALSCGLFHYIPVAGCFPNVPVSFPPGSLATGLTLDCVLIQIVNGNTLVVSNVARVNT